MGGKLIVFEGTDGSGKSTQFQKLCDRLDGMGRSYQRLVFPQYDQPSSALIRMYLGGEFLADRYTTSNAVHQGAKCAPEERQAFFRWLDEFEHDKLGLPRADLVVYLDMPTEKAVELLRSREASTNTKADIHELDTAYLAACRTCALQAAEQLGWHVVHCLDDAGRLRSIEDIHSEIWALVEKEL